MTEEEKKLKYQNIAYRLSIINNKINNLNKSIYLLKNTTQKSILINDEGINEDELNNVSNNLESTSNSIKYTIIPSLYRKIYN